MSEERTNCLEPSGSLKGCGRPLYWDDDDWTCGRMDKPRSYRYCKDCDPENGVRYVEMWEDFGYKSAAHAAKEEEREIREYRKFLSANTEPSR